MRVGHHICEAHTTGLTALADGTPRLGVPAPMWS
jgi:hypothetical protein